MPMSGSVIDTNVIIKMLNNDEAAISLLSGIEQAYLPVTVVGELYYGAMRSSHKQENMAVFQQVISDFEILPIDIETADSYASIKAGLVASGINIPENDLWIAACAHAHQLSLATFDGHFSHIHSIEKVQG
jgi:tRNA(fMet)-specific endonuclease VapC